MPVPILQKIKFNPDGGVIKVELKFQTMLLCTYDLDYRETGSNSSVAGFPCKGDNSNAQDDVYSLPMPPSVNMNRSLWIFVTVIDQVGDGGSYQVDIIITQDGNQLGILTPGEKKLVGNLKSEILIAKFIV
ncbi:MAG: hypothetical protein HY800_05705 [Ignavibacteriales bacterium]|nr:hypothetical protein [Ignavibacteriales bacterium]